MLNVVGKIYAEILVDWVRRVTEGLTDDKQEGSFRSGKVCVYQIFILKVRKHVRKHEGCMWVLWIWRSCMIE